MKNKKRVLAIALVVALVAVAVTGATLAWFTDTDGVTNVFTLGKISANLNDTDENGDPFNDSEHVMLPGVPVVKKVSVTNTGNNDEYVRTYIAVPEKLDGVLNMTFNTSDGWVLDSSDYIADIDGIRYKVYQFTYDSKLEPGDSTPNVLEKVELSNTVDCQNDQLGIYDEDGKFQVLGFSVDALRELDIPVAMQAIQADGFDSGEDALATFGGCPWDEAAAEESPAAVSLSVKADDLNKDNEIVWNPPEGSGFDKLIFNIPAGTFDVPVKAEFETSKLGDSPCLDLRFVQIDENGDPVMDGDEPVLVSPDWAKFSIEVFSPYPKVGDESSPKAIIGIDTGNPFTDAMNAYNCCNPWNVTTE